MSTDESRVEVHLGRYAVVDFDPSLTFECVEECTWCCHHGVLLYEQDLLELAARESSTGQQGNGSDAERSPRS